MSDSRADRGARRGAAAVLLLLALTSPGPLAAQDLLAQTVTTPGVAPQDGASVVAIPLPPTTQSIATEEASVGGIAPGGAAGAGTVVAGSAGSEQAGAGMVITAPQGILPGADAPEGGPTNLQVQIDSQSAANRYQPTGDAEGLGILGPNVGGFGRALWTGTNRRVLEALLPRLPVNNPSPALFDLARRLLLSDAVMPNALLSGKGVSQANLLEVRLDRLAALGEIEGLKALLEVLPPDELPDEQRRVGIELLLTRGETSAACAEVRDGNAGDGGDRFWLKALVYCQIVSGERSAAELGLTILRDSARPEERVFLRLADAALGVQPLNPAEIGRLDPAGIMPLEFALLTSLGLPLPPRLVLEASPRALLQLVHNETANLDDRTQAAEWAVATRRLPAGDLALLYGAFGFSSGQIAGALNEGYGLSGVEARALYYQSIGQQPQPEQEIQAAELALERAEADGVYAATARVVLPALTINPDDASFAWFADTAGRALYVLGRYEEATAWLLLARQEAAISARAAVAAHRLWPYSRLAGVAAISNESGLEGWRFAQPDPQGPKVAQQLSLLRVLFEALGETDAMAWIDLAMTDDERARPLPEASLLYALEDASYSGRLGETVLLALIVMGDTPPAEAHPLALNAVLSALMQVGLPLEARALAIEAALGNGI